MSLGYLSLLGVSLQWLTAVCDFPGRGFFSGLSLSPLAIPAYVFPHSLRLFCPITSARCKTGLRYMAANQTWSGFPYVRSRTGRHRCDGSGILSLCLPVGTKTPSSPRASARWKPRNRWVSVVSQGILQIIAPHGPAMDRRRRNAGVMETLGRFWYRCRLQLRYLHDRHL